MSLKEDYIDEAHVDEPGDLLVHVGRFIAFLAEPRRIPRRIRGCGGMCSCDSADEAVRVPEESTNDGAND